MNSTDASEFLRANELLQRSAYLVELITVEVQAMQGEVDHDNRPHPRHIEFASRLNHELARILYELQAM